MMTIDDGGSDGGGEAQASNFLLFIDANQQQLTTEEKPFFGNYVGNKTSSSLTVEQAMNERLNEPTG